MSRFKETVTGTVKIYIPFRETINVHGKILSIHRDELLQRIALLEIFEE